jgi:outer membrane protein assembly factor BamB
LTASEEIALTVYKVNEPEFVQIARYLAGAGSPVALDQNVIAVGGDKNRTPSAMYADTGALLSVFAYPNQAVASASFGVGVASSSGRVLISAQSDDSVFTDSGAAYLFDLQTGDLLRMFAHPNAAPPTNVGQAFGTSVALHTNRALISQFRGPVFLFDADTGELLREFPSATTRRDSLDLSDTLAAVGNTTGGGQLRPGLVSVYDVETGIAVTTLPNPTPEDSDFFGEAVAIDGDRILVGSGQVDVGGIPNAGEAYLFDARTGDLLHTFTSPLPEEDGWFGRVLDIDGDIVAIASANMLKKTSVDIFDAVTGEHRQTLIEIPDHGGYGQSIDIDGTDMVVGATEGSVYHYRLSRFVDTPPDYWAHSFIEGLAASNITVGCGDRNYCPEEPVTRAQMAVFLERGIRGAAFQPPAASGAIFEDVAATDFAAAFIEQLFLDGITGGCGNNNYCPNDSVTRAQMSVFLLRAKYGATYVPPPPTGVFADVPVGSFADRWIEALAAEGITSGCGNNDFCPDNPVTRAQMAVFLVRAFELQ